MHTLASSALERALLGARFWGDSVVCVSQAVAQSVGRGPGARDVVYNGVPVPSQVRGPAPRSGRLLFAGRITPGKGLAVLLEALGRVRDLPWSLSVLGRAWGVEDEQELQRLKARATALGISERVTWKGFLPLDDQWLTHDFLVFPSEWVEACPLVVLEAMAHGLVVVASGVGGVPELVQDRRTGYLVPPSDPEALAAQLRRVLVGEGTELETTAAAARQTVGRDFALPTQVERLKAAFFSGVA
jgi:glycosyltransferase involved in cell wall biosynthesis